MSIAYNLKYLLASGLGMVTSFLSSSRGQKVLLYHSIGTPVEGDIYGIYSVSPEQFKNQMKTISENDFKVVAFGENSFDNTISITFDDGFKDNLTEGAKILSQFGFPFTVFVIADFVKKGREDYLSIEDLKVLSKTAGCTIGLHGNSHRPLGKLSKEEVVSELSLGKKVIEDIVGKEIKTMSFPHGSYSKQVVDAAREVGFEKCASSNWGTFNQGDDLFTINRVSILRTDGIINFKSKLKTGWAFMSRKSQEY